MSLFRKLMDKLGMGNQADASPAAPSPTPDAQPTQPLTPEQTAATAPMATATLPIQEATQRPVQDLDAAADRPTNPKSSEQPPEVARRTKESRH